MYIGTAVMNAVHQTSVQSKLLPSASADQATWGRVRLIDASKCLWLLDGVY